MWRAGDSGRAAQPFRVLLLDHSVSSTRCDLDTVSLVRGPRFGRQVASKLAAPRDTHTGDFVLFLEGAEHWLWWLSGSPLQDP